MQMVRSTILLLLVCAVFAKANTDTCTSCGIPCARPEDRTFTVRLSGDRKDPSMVFTHLSRTTATIAGQVLQAYRLGYTDTERKCRDTVILANDMGSLVMGVTLGKVPPLHVPIRPVSAYRLTSIIADPTSFAEIGAFAAYTGSDDSRANSQPIGINSLYYGADIVVAPFGDLLGYNVSLGLGVGATNEAARLRIPVLAQLRFSFSGTSTIVESKYIPDSCTFECSGRKISTPVIDSGITGEGSYERLPGPDSVDSTTILLLSHRIVRDASAPYVFLEGGPIFDGGFEGAGAEPSENPSDWGQYLLGGGAGLPVVGGLHVQLAYRYMRLNLRTPCEQCNEVFQVNTNVVHSILLRALYHIGW